MKKVELWADTGTKTAPDSQRKTLGWLPNDRPPAEEWNWVQNNRDVAVNNNVDGVLSACGGTPPHRLLGVSDNGIPIMRPNAFYNDDAIHYPDSPINALSASSEDVLSMSIGWDPSKGKPIVAYGTSGSVANDSDTSATVFIKACWEYENPATVESRTVNFGTAVRKSANEFQVLVCDGKLYVMVGIGAYYNRTVFMYDLTNWTGSPEDSIEVTSGDTAGGNATELIEANDTQIAFGYNHSDYEDIFCYLIEKDLSASTDRSTRITGGITQMQAFLRSDGVNLYGSYYDDNATDAAIFAFRIADGVYSTLGVAVADTGLEVIDIIPSGVFDLQPDVLCYFFDPTHSQDPFVQWARNMFISPAWCGGRIEPVSDTAYVKDAPGCLCQVGGNIAMSFANSVSGDDFVSYSMADMSRVWITDFTAYTYSLTSIGTGSEYRMFPRLGGRVDAADYTNVGFNCKMMYDGRDLWSATRTAGVVTRVVSPLTRRA